MKDKNKRDKERIKSLTNQLQDMTENVFKKDRMCRELIQLSVKSGADKGDIFEIIKDSHSLRKQI